MRRNPARWAKFAALLAVLAMIAPLAVNSIPVAAQEGKVLRVHQITYPDDFDPQMSSFSNEIAILALAYEGLTRQDTDLQTVPAAAESWTVSPDATVFTFTLREGLKWSDGEPLTAEHFRYAVERTCDPTSAGEYDSILFDIKGCAELNGLLAPAGEGTPAPEIDQAAFDAAVANLGAKALDDRTLEITTAAPAPYMVTVASLWVFYPVRQDIVEAAPDNWWQTAENHIGNGPFTITGIEEDQQITFAANENYWQGRPVLDGIEYVYQGETAIALESFRNGDLHIAQLDPSQIPEVQEDPEYLAYPVAFTANLAFNLSQEPFNDIEVRKAFSHAFDRETYCTVIRNGDCSPTLSWIPEGIPGSITTDQYGFDPEAAVAALAASSYGGPDGLPPISLYWNSDDPAATPRAEWVAGQYRDILGIEITLEPTEGTALIDLRKNPETFPQMLLVGGWYQDYPDPQNWLSVYWKCDATFAQRFAYCNEEFDALVEQGDTTVDPEARVGFYEQASQILVDDVPGPFLYNLLQTVMVDDAVTGYTALNLDAEWPGQFASLMTLDIAAEE